MDEEYINRYNFIEDLSDGEVLDLIFAKFGIDDDDNATEQLLRKIDKVLLLTTFQREEDKWMIQQK